MPLEYEEFTDTKIIYSPPESRFKVIKKWEFSAEIQGARSGLLLLFLCTDSLVYSEIDDDPLYGGGYPKRERVQSIENYKQFGSVHPFPEWVLNELHPLLNSK